MAKDHFQSTTEIIWADESFLAEHKVASFTNLPLWAPLSEDRGFMQISNQKLKESGFQFTPVTTTLEDCRAWFSREMDPAIRFGTDEIAVGLERSREMNLIRLLKG